jgi:hypothetical protein
MQILPPTTRTAEKEDNNMTDPELPDSRDWYGSDDPVWEAVQEMMVNANLAIIDATMERENQIERLIENGRPDPRTFPTWAELTKEES